MNNYSHDSPPKKVQTKSSGTEESLIPPPNEIIQHVGVNLVVDAVDNNYSLLLRPRWQTVCRMSISVCPLAMWSTDKHSTVTLSEGTAVFIGGQQWAAGVTKMVKRQQIFTHLFLLRRRETTNDVFKFID